MGYDQKHFCHGRGRGFEPPSSPPYIPKRLRMFGYQVTIKSRSNKGPITALLRGFEVFFGCLLTHVGHHHPYNFALCGPLIRVHGLGVDIQRDPAVRVP